MTRSTIIIDGKEAEVIRGKVRTWHETGLAFHAGRGGSAVERTEKIRAVVVHTTASERVGDRGAKILHDSMMHRSTPLSVEFLIDNEGTIYQFVDPAELRCRHASRVNPWTIGIECSGRLVIKKDTLSKRPSYRSPPLAGGWRPHLLGLYDPQVDALIELCRTLRTVLELPEEVLTTPWERRPEGFFESWEGGICGHIHCAHLSVKRPKIDPGPRPLEILAEKLAVR